MCATLRLMTNHTCRRCKRPSRQYEGVVHKRANWCSSSGPRPSVCPGTPLLSGLLFHEPRPDLFGRPVRRDAPAGCRSPS